MKKIIALILVVVMWLTLVGCSSSDNQINDEPYRKVIYGMSFEDVKIIEKEFGSKFIEEEDDVRILYEAKIDGETVRIAYFFNEGKLEYYTIAANPEFGTRDYLGFYDDFIKMLNSSYSTLIDDGETYWYNSYEVAGVSLYDNEIGNYALFAFSLKQSAVTRN